MRTSVMGLPPAGSVVAHPVTTNLLAGGRRTSSSLGRNVQPPSIAPDLTSRQKRSVGAKGQ